MEKTEFIKKEVTFERVLMGVGIILLIVVMALYYLGAFDNVDGMANQENTVNDVLQQERPSMDDFLIEQNEREEVKAGFEEGYMEFGEVEEIVTLATSEFIQCLADSGMVIYGSSTCPACATLINLFGGYELAEPIYVECSDDWDVCEANKETGYVPEVRINDVLFEGERSLENFAAETGCEL